MSKFHVIAAILVSAMCGGASANGTYDGVYSSPVSSSNYFSVHQSGNSLIVASFDTMPASGINVTAAGSVYAPTRYDFWDLYNGTINGNTATLSGQALYGACTRTVTLVFSSTGFVASQFTASATASGSSQRVNCNALIPAAGTLSFSKVF